MHQTFIALGLLVVISFTGCRSYQVRPMPQLSASETPAQALSSGIRMGAKPYNNDAECRAVFNYSLSSKGVVPVLLVIQNDSADDVEIVRAAIELETGSGSVLRPINPDATVSGHGRNAMAEAIFFFGIFSYDNANRYNQDMNRDWIEKGMGEVKYVRSGRSVSRFLYFEAGQGFSPSGSILHVPYRSSTGYGRGSLSLRFD